MELYRIKVPKCNSTGYRVKMQVASTNEERRRRTREVGTALRRDRADSAGNSQSLPHSQRGSSSAHGPHTLYMFFYFEYGDNLCNVLYFSLFLFRQGPHLRMMFFSLRFSPFASCRLILMRTDRVEPSTRWKYQIRPSGDRTPRDPINCPAIQLPFQSSLLRFSFRPAFTA